MTAELEVYAPPVTSVAHWAHEASDAHKLAKALVTTSFVPVAYKDKPDEAAACIVKGAEIGLTPLAALGSINVINGTPALSAMALRALAQSQGHTVWIEKSSDKEAIAKARRRGESETHTSKWTIARANQLGITSKANWQKQPEAMLIARATSEVCRMVAADALLGIGYSVEELQDLDDAPASNGAVPATSARRAPRKRADAPKAEPAPVDEPPLDDEPQPEATPEPPAPITKDQSKKLHAVFGDIGWTDRDDKLRAATLIVGRTLESSNDLTKAEASRLIDELETIAQQHDPSDALTRTLEALARDAEIVDGEVT